MKQPKGQGHGQVKVFPQVFTLVKKGDSLVQVLYFEFPCACDKMVFLIPVGSYTLTCSLFEHRFFLMCFYKVGKISRRIVKSVRERAKPSLQLVHLSSLFYSFLQSTVPQPPNPFYSLIVRSVEEGADIHRKTLTYAIRKITITWDAHFNRIR